MYILSGPDINLFLFVNHQIFARCIASKETHLQYFLVTECNVVMFEVCFL